MKYTTSLLAGLLVVGLVAVSGCSKDRKIERRLIGEWEVVKKDKDHAKQKDVLDIDLTFVGYCTFNKNRTGSCDMTGDFTIKYKPDSCQGSGCEDVFNMKVSENVKITKWDVKDNKLIIEYEDGTQEVYIITESSKDEFKLDGTEEGNVSMTIPAPEGGVVTIDVVYYMELKRKK